MKNVMEFLSYNESPAVFDTYTACMSEHGIADNAGSRHAELAVQSRMSPVFVHDPRRGDTLAERFVLDGNPDIGKDWTTTTLAYVDADGQAQLKEIPFTPADFAVHEGRFKKHFRPADADANLVPVPEYIDLNETERHGKMPFIWSTDDDRRLIKLAVSPAIVELTEERRRNWRMLEYLGGLHVDRMQEDHRRELEQWQHKYAQADTQRESSIDAIARGMAELAAGSDATASQSVVPLDAITMGASVGAMPEAGPKAGDAPLVRITEADMPKCTNCKTCYQDLRELFEKTTIMVDGEPKEVSRVIPGVLDKIELTPELIRTAARVATDCDAEIIRFQQPTTG
ncbi:hypothetical protein [Candidatus Thiosymbion oneisti]|nr:hypothetical protein [Candidatus Thiosymbion oneisti]